MMDEKRAWRLFSLAWDRLDGRRPGFGMLILWHLALRGFSPAMLELAHRLDRRGSRAANWSSAGLAFRAWRLGNPLGAQHLAMDGFNGNYLVRYRRWLSMAARSGDKSAAAELKRFETRLPHYEARRIGRHRPFRKDE